MRVLTLCVNQFVGKTWNSVIIGKFLLRLKEIKPMKGKGILFILLVVVFLPLSLSQTFQQNKNNRKSIYMREKKTWQILLVLVKCLVKRSVKKNGNLQN